MKKFKQNTITIYTNDVAKVNMLNRKAYIEITAEKVHLRADKLKTGEGVTCTHTVIGGKIDRTEISFTREAFECIAEAYLQLRDRKEREAEYCNKQMWGDCECETKCRRGNNFLKKE